MLPLSLSHLQNTYAPVSEPSPASAGTFVVLLLYLEQSQTERGISAYTATWTDGSVAGRQKHHCNYERLILEDAPLLLKGANLFFFFILFPVFSNRN